MLHIQANASHNPEGSHLFLISYILPILSMFGFIWFLLFVLFTMKQQHRGSSVLPYSCTPLTRGFTAAPSEPYGVIELLLPVPVPVSH